MDSGPDILIDYNRLSYSPRVFFEGPQRDLRVNPIAIIKSPDLDATLKHVRSKDAFVAQEIELRLGVRFSCSKILMVMDLWCVRNLVCDTS